VLASEFCTPIGGALTAGASANEDGAASPIAQDLATQRPAGKRQQKRRAHGSEEPQCTCDVPGCEYTTTRVDNLDSHQRAHSTLPQPQLSQVCDEPGCSYKCRVAHVLAAHKRLHGDEQAFACDVPDCGYMTTQASNFERHKRRWHSGQPQPQLETQLQPQPLPPVRRRRPPQTASGECDEPGCRAAVCNGLSHYQFLDVLASEFCTPIGGALTAGASASEDGAALPIAQDLATRTQRPAGKRQLPLDAEDRPHACDSPGCEYTTTCTDNLGQHKRTHSGARTRSPAGEATS